MKRILFLLLFFFNKTIISQNLPKQVEFCFNNLLYIEYNTNIAYDSITFLKEDYRNYELGKFSIKLDFNINQFLFFNDKNDSIIKHCTILEIIHNDWYDNEFKFEYEIKLQNNSIESTIYMTPESQICIFTELVYNSTYKRKILMPLMYYNVIIDY